MQSDYGTCPNHSGAKILFHVESLFRGNLYGIVILDATASGLQNIRHDPWRLATFVETCWNRVIFILIYLFPRFISGLVTSSLPSGLSFLSLHARHFRHRSLPLFP